MANSKHRTGKHYVSMLGMMGISNPTYKLAYITGGINSQTVDPKQSQVQDYLYLLLVSQWTSVIVWVVDQEVVYLPRHTNCQLEKFEKLLVIAEGLYGGRIIMTCINIQHIYC